MNRAEGGQRVLMKENLKTRNDFQERSLPDLRSDVIRTQSRDLIKVVAVPSRQHCEGALAVAANIHVHSPANTIQVL